MDTLSDDDFDKLRPTSIKVTLYAGKEVVDTVTLDAEHGWSYTFYDLAVNNKGAAIEYSVSEVKVDIILLS